MGLFSYLLDINTLPEKEIIQSIAYELKPYDIITSLANVNSPSPSTSPIGDVITVSTLYRDYSKRYKTNSLWLISSKFLARVVNFDTTSITFEILDSYLQNFNPSDYTSYFVNKFLYELSFYIEKNSDQLSNQLLNLKNKEPFYNAYEASLNYYNSKQVYNNFLSKIRVKLSKNTILNRYEISINIDGTSIPETFYQKISNLFINIQIYSFDVVFFFERVEGQKYNDEGYTQGCVYNYKTNLLDIKPHYTFQIPNDRTDMAISLSDVMVNRNTEFEDLIGINQAKKLVIFINFSLKPIDNFKHVFENVQTLPFYIII